jgi:hypothetical protein
MTSFQSIRQHAHSEFERGLGAKDHNWLVWYAAYIARE